MGRMAASRSIAARSTTWNGERVQVEIFTRVADSVLRATPLGPLQLVAMRCGSVTISRSPEPAERPADPALTFILQTAGHAEFRHYGHQIALSEGDFTLCDNSAPYSLHFDRPAELVMLRVPVRAARETLPTPDCFCGRRLDRRQSLASTAAAMVRDLACKDETELSPTGQERAGRHLLDVLASAYAETVDAMETQSSVMAGRLWKVKLYIEQHLRDPELSPAVIAERLRLSDRYMRMIFAPSGESPSAYVLRRRLEECARQLRDPGWRARSITDIAFGWGFNSAPHFARTFRERFDMSPRDFRRLHLDGSGEAGGTSGRRRAGKTALAA